MLRVTVTTVVLLCFGAANLASAEMYNFYGITNNRSADTAIGAAQLSVEVTSAGSGLVDFMFRNIGGSASSITDIYFDDYVLLQYHSLTNGSGVRFARYASPSELPGANNLNPDFNTTSGLAFDSDSPVQPNGVNPGEWLRIRFSLRNNQTFADVLSDLTLGALRVGLHVQGFAGGGSESFVNTPTPVPVPLPGAAALGVLGLGLSARLRRILG